MEVVIAEVQALQFRHIDDIYARKSAETVVRQVEMLEFWEFQSRFQFAKLIVREVELLEEREVEVRHHRQLVAREIQVHDAPPRPHWSDVFVNMAQHHASGLSRDPAMGGKPKQFLFLFRRGAQSLSQALAASEHSRTRISAC